MKFLDEKRKAKLEADKAKVDAELLELKQIEDANNLEKSKKAGHRKSLEHQQVTRQQMFHSMSPLQVRVMFFYVWLSKNYGLVQQKDIETYIVNARLKTYFDTLDKNDSEGPEKPLKFSETDDLIE